MQPTTDCLVYLTDPPFFCVTLSDIEIVHLERVQFGLKNFDLVIVLKDFAVTPLHINSIPMDQIENVKEWLEFVFPYPVLSMYVLPKVPSTYPGFRS